MKTRIHTYFGIFPADIGVGPSRFARFENEGQPVSAQSIDRTTTFTPDIMDRAWGVLADMTAQRWRNNEVLDPLRDEEEDPAKKTCPTGGCPPENKKTNRDIYDDQIKQVAGKNNLDLSDPKQKREAHMYVVDYMRPKLRENRKYEKQDREGPLVGEGPEFILKDGGIFYPKYGASLQRLYENQKRVYPKQYDRKQHATMTLMERMFVNGATRVEHVSHNTDQNGNEAIRDKIIMRWDSVTQKGTMEIRNIALEGNYHSAEDAFQIMKDDSSGMAEVHPEEGVAILTDKPLPSEEVSEVLSSFDLDTNTPAKIATDTTETFSYVGHQLYEDAGELVQIARDRLIEELRKKDIVVPQYLQRLLGIFHVSDQTEEPTTMNFALFEQLNRILLLLPEDNTTHHEDVLLLLWRQKIEQVLQLSPEGSAKIFDQIEQIWNSERKARKHISFIGETGVGIGAGIAIVDMQVLLDFSNLEEHPIIKAVDKPSENKSQPQEVSEEAHQEDIVMTWLSSFIARTKDMPPEEALLEVQKEEEKTLENVATIWLLFLSFGQKEKIGSTVIEEMPLEEKETVEQFQLAVVVWFLLKFTSYFEGLEALKEKQSVPEALIHSEETQWILFAIIWHLAMIREQGFIQTTNNQPPPTKPSLQRTAVIYAYAS